MQDVAAAIGDISILPVERNTVTSAVLMPEAQRAGTGRDCELLIKRAVPGGLGPATADWVPASGAPGDGGLGPSMRKRVGDERRPIRAVNYPWWEAASLKSTVYDSASVTRGR